METIEQTDGIAAGIAATTLSAVELVLPLIRDAQNPILVPWLPA